MLNKIKYQNPNFRRKLQEARDYKRSYKKIPDTKMGIFLARLGLSSRLSKVLVFLIFLGLLYMFFAPNFLSIKRVEITGVNDNSVKSSVEADIKKFFESSPFWPQSNLLLLSKKGLSEYLTSKNKQVLQVTAVDKDFPSSLSVKIEERYNKFFLKTPSGAYLLSNDGLVGKQLVLEDFSASPTPYSTLIPMTSQKNEQFYEGQRVQDAEYFKNLSEILLLSEEDALKIIAIEMESFEHANISAIFPEGFQIKFDINSDLAKTFIQLRLLLKEVGQGRINGIKYIDMRVKDRGYVCYKDAACANEFNPPQAATTTLEGIKD